MTPHDGFRIHPSGSALLLRFDLRTDFTAPPAPCSTPSCFSWRLRRGRVRPRSRLRAESFFFSVPIAECHSVAGRCSAFWSLLEVFTSRGASAAEALPRAAFLTHLASPNRMPAISTCLPSPFPFHLAWHSLGLKPCARRLGPFCFAHNQRALQVSAPPATFQTSRKSGSMKSCRSPRKSTSPDLGAAASRSSGAQTKRAEKE